MTAAGFGGVEKPDRQFASEPAALPVVSHHQPDLATLIVDYREVPETHRLDTIAPVVLRDQREVVTVVDRDELPEQRFRQLPQRRKKAQATRLGAEPFEQLPDRRPFEWPEGPSPDTGAVREDDRIFQRG